MPRQPRRGSGELAQGNIERRPDGMTHIPFRNGKCLVWHSTCIDTLAACYLDKTSESAGKAAEVAEQDKIDKYRELEDNYIFVPLAFETFGAWGESAKTLVRTVGKLLSNALGDPRQTQYLFQRFSLEIQRGNAVSVMGTLPEEKVLKDVFWLL